MKRSAAFLLSMVCGSVSGALGQTVVSISPNGEGFLSPASHTQAVVAGSRARMLKPFRIPKIPSADAPKPGLAVPSPTPLPVASAGSNTAGLLGLTNLDQVASGTGVYAHSQFTLEPPDQALAVGNGFVMEAVNLAIAAYDSKTGILVAGPTPLNQFFNLAPGTSSFGPPFGPFTSDPRIQYDATTQRWFLTLLEIDVVPSTGAFGNHSHLEIAVSKSSDPTKGWFLYSLDTTDDGSNGITHPTCPCFGDQPLSGLDANGFYVTTNEFPIASVPGFNGAQVYAMSKSALELGTLTKVVAFGNIPLAGNLSYSLQPAMTPPGVAFASNTEYFLSALDFNANLDNRIAVWALTNTDTLNASTPAVHILGTVISSEVYGQPPNVTQAPGSIPLGNAAGDPESVISANDDRMNQTTYLYGTLWGAVNTVVKSPGGGTAVGTAYFAVRPTVSSGQLTAIMLKQGYVSVAPNSVLYPAVALNFAGKGLIGFALAGPAFFPSAAYISLTSAGTGSSVLLAAAGIGPEDGFTGYPSLDSVDNGVSRWGDYSAATTDSDGSVWFATEMIPNLERGLYANWGTFIGRVIP